MNKDISNPSENDFEKLLSQKQFLDLIVNQLNKDLGSHNSNILYQSIENAADQILNQLIKLLKEIDQLPGKHILNLMYRVDINSNRFHHILNQYSGNEYYQFLANEILNREMKKVWFRLNYKA